MIPFNHVGLNAKRHKKTILDRIGKIIDGGDFFDGEETQLLLTNLKSHLGDGHIVLTSSGHDALLLSLLALAPSVADEVIFPVNAYPTAFPIIQSGARPVPADVDDNGQISPAAVAKSISKNTKAIVVVHLYGLVGDFDKIRALSRKNKLFLIEDCAQAFGTCYRGQPIGTLGDIGCFSFYPTKNVGTLGDGGAIFTRIKKIHAFLEKAVRYGERLRYVSEFIAGHSRMPAIQKAVINIYFTKARSEFRKRKRLADEYQRLFLKYGLNKWVSLLKSSVDSDVVKHLMVAAVPKRGALRKFLADRKIPTMIHYPHPIHLLPAFSFLNLQKGAFPKAEKLSRQILSLPFHAFLSGADIDYVASTIREFYETSF